MVCIWPEMKNVLFSLPKNIKNMIYGLVKKWQMHLFIFWTIYILDLVLSFIDKCRNSNGNKLCPLVADLFLFCYERDFMKSLT